VKVPTRQPSRPNHSLEQTSVGDSILHSIMKNLSFSQKSCVILTFVILSDVDHREDTLCKELLGGATRVRSELL